jgi:uncharacterized membrane protein
VNVGEFERLVSAIGGGVLAGVGLSRGDETGLLMAAAGGALMYRGFTGHCHMYEALGINSSGERHSPVASVAAGAGVKVTDAVTINRPVEVVYRFWRNFENLPRVMRHLESVRVNGEQSHWVACGPMGWRVEWDAEIINDRPNEVIAWRSLAGSPVDSAGSVHFQHAPGNRGTEGHVSLEYDPPAGKEGTAVAKLFGREPRSQVREDLLRLKQWMETGEIATTAGQPSGCLEGATP